MTGDARTLALELRPPELDDVGLAGAVETFLTQWTSRYGIPVDLELCNLEARVPPAEPATTIFRILQEAMTNIARHSSASEVSVIVERPDGHINLIVEDNGRGFNVDEVLRRASRDQRFGLAGMRERAELAGGELDVESAIGVGTTLFVKVPVQEAGTDAAAT
jgi:two-component system sensor histidine kinase UhpB